MKRDSGKAPFKSKWTAEKILATAKGYDSKNSFRAGNCAAYGAAYRHEFGIEYFCGHMKKNFKRWNFDDILRVARQYKTIKEFRIGDYAAYSAGLRSGRRTELYSHMNKKRNEIPRSVYIIESTDGRSAYVGLSCDPKRRYREHKRRGKSAVRELISSEHRLRILAEDLTETDAQELEKATIMELAEKGVTVLNAVSGGALGALGSFRWSEPDIQKEALKYKTITSFQRGSPGAYGAATRRFGGVERFSKHMKKLNYWDAKSIGDEALKYKTRTEFEKIMGGAVNAARRLGIMDKVCSHMSKRACVDA
ncbi:GIY-YIG catalytic domain protein [Labrenzia sp. THAF35]|uniref:GIY-YIG nuclease family protein n=1 Tax=Labrenzia sp. THAF35 TaxID=2587854 RepID=UPI0012682D4C|nr:GIY-YIG nuclease family protein [Labrenzia sp. THAF35]QFT69647.1 GIY-YIG catalytic domain protein [Labrenzia sp. THAF35]